MKLEHHWLDKLLPEGVEVPILQTMFKEIKSVADATRKKTIPIISKI